MNVNSLNAEALVGYIDRQFADSQKTIGRLDHLSLYTHTDDDPYHEERYIEQRCWKMFLQGCM